MNRSLGLPDPYPFAPPAQAIDKIRFIHEVIEESANANAKADSAERPSAA